MENRRPIKLTRREEILRMKDSAPPPADLLEAEDSVVSDENNNESTTESTETDPGTEETQIFNKKKDREKKTKYWVYILAVFIVLYSVYVFGVHRRYSLIIAQMERDTDRIEKRVIGLEEVLKSKYREVDVADYLEGARVIYDLTTPPYRKKSWLLKETKGYNGELAIDKVCTKGHCYSFNGSEGKLAIAFKNEKIIKKIGISHPIFDSRKSAIKRFTLDCIVNNKERRIGEFEYEIPGDSFQQFSFPPVSCTGILIRVKSNHGQKEYTCIYKVYAFE